VELDGYCMQVSGIRLVLASESRHKGCSMRSVRSLVVDEERMRSGHWLGSVLCVSFCALTLMVGWQEGHVAHKKPVSLTPRTFVKEQLEEENWLTEVH